MKSDRLQTIEVHPRLIRWAHWVNFVSLSLMIWSGLLIYWANDVYIPIPDAWAEKLRLHHRLAEGMSWHFAGMWIFALNGFLYVLVLMFSGYWREILFSRKTRGIYHGIQKVAYALIILCGLGSVATGLAILKPVQLGWLTALFGGYENARLLHFVCMLSFVFFFFVHVFQVVNAGWNIFRGMVAGYELKRRET